MIITHFKWNYFNQINRVYLRSYILETRRFEHFAVVRDHGLNPVKIVSFKTLIYCYYKTKCIMQI